MVLEQMGCFQQHIDKYKVQENRRHKKAHEQQPKKLYHRYFKFWHNFERLTFSTKNRPIFFLE